MASMNVTVLGLSMMIIIIIILSSAPIPSEAMSKDKSFYPYTHVHIKDDMSDVNGTIGLRVHCKSKNDDRGEQEVGPGETYSFRFRPKFFGGTVWRCSVAWDGCDGVREFKAYSEKRDFRRCRIDCCWSIQPDGPRDCSTGELFPWSY